MLFFLLPLVFPLKEIIGYLGAFFETTAIGEVFRSKLMSISLFGEWWIDSWISRIVFAKISVLCVCIHRCYFQILESMLFYTGIHIQYWVEVFFFVFQDVFTIYSSSSFMPKTLFWILEISLSWENSAIWGGLKLSQLSYKDFHSLTSNESFFDFGRSFNFSVFSTIVSIRDVKWNAYALS